MLPSFRLIVATFLCGFAVVYGGLRLAVSLNAVLPVTAAHAGSHVLPTADGEARLAAIPAMFDTRFAIGPAPAVLVRTMPSVLERPSLPLSVTTAPAADVLPTATTEPAEPPSSPERMLATVQSDTPAGPAAVFDAETAASPDIPPPADAQH